MQSCIWWKKITVISHTRFIHYKRKRKKKTLFVISSFLSRNDCGFYFSIFMQRGKDYAVDKILICMSRNLTISEGLAETLSPSEYQNRRKMEPSKVEVLWYEGSLFNKGRFIQLSWFRRYTLFEKRIRILIIAYFANLLLWTCGVPILFSE